MAAEGTKQRVAVALLIGLLATLLLLVQDVPIGTQRLDLQSEKYEMKGLVAPALSGISLRIFSCQLRPPASPFCPSPPSPHSFVLFCRCSQVPSSSPKKVTER